MSWFFHEHASELYRVSNQLAHLISYSLGRMGRRGSTTKEPTPSAVRGRRISRNHKMGGLDRNNFSCAGSVHPRTSAFSFSWTRREQLDDNATGKNTSALFLSASGRCIEHCLRWPRTLQDVPGYHGARTRVIHGSWTNFRFSTNLLKG